MKSPLKWHNQPGKNIKDFWRVQNGQYIYKVAFFCVKVQALYWTPSLTFEIKIVVSDCKIGNNKNKDKTYIKV